MANRNKNFDEYVAQEFEDIKFAQSFLTHLVNDEGLTLEAALREAIVSMGLQTFSEKAQLSISYVSDFVNMRKKWSTDKLVKCVEMVFKLKVKLIIDSKKSSEVA